MTGVTIRKDTRVLRRMITGTPEQLNRAVLAAAIDVNSEIVLSFGTSPSAPGDPPGVDTGALRASMKAEKGDQDMTAIVYAGVEYAPYLEFGTERMAARPFFTPVLLRWERGEFARFLKDFGVVR